MKKDCVVVTGGNFGLGGDYVKSLKATSKSFLFQEQRGRNLREWSIFMATSLMKNF